MPLNSVLRVPVDETYAAHLGTAVYVFAYYESTIINIIDRLRAGFMAIYTRGKPMTSGDVARELKKVIDDTATNFTKLPHAELTILHSRFTALIERRNALIHAHPITAQNGDQIFAYQGNMKKSITDMHWPPDEIAAFTGDTDAAAVEAADMFEKVR